MSELKIDEQWLEIIKERTCAIIRRVESDVDDMTDTDLDVFDRYMSFKRIEFFLAFAEKMHPMFCVMFASGFNLTHPVFDTESRKKCGWVPGKGSPEKDNFFLSGNQETLLEAIHDLLGSLRGRGK